MKLLFTIVYGTSWSSNEPITEVVTNILELPDNLSPTDLVKKIGDHVNTSDPRSERVKKANFGGKGSAVLSVFYERL